MSNKPSTREEILALPIGPKIEYITIEHSEEDKKNGYIFINEKKFEINTKVSKTSFPYWNKAPILHFDEDNDIMYVIDDEGQSWSLGKYEDGSWFKQSGNF